MKSLIAVRCFAVRFSGLSQATQPTPAKWQMPILPSEMSIAFPARPCA
jgi:hypothetical protein